MAFKTFADAATLPAADLNTYLMKQAVIVCTSGTRPSSPVEGMTIYETDTDSLKIYTTATTTWVAPWNLPWGYMTSNSSSTAQTGISSVTDMNGTSVTWTAISTRRYKVTMSGAVYGTTAGDVIGVQIVDGAAALQRIWSAAITDNNIVMNWQLEMIVTGITGSQTWKARLLRNSGSGTMATYTTDVTNMAYVEDIGPSGAPA